jgi:hypothetical protein
MEERSSDRKFGRSQTEWDQLAEAGRHFLEERARLENTTSYTEMNAVLANRTGVRPFDFDREDERAAMGYLLGMIVDKTFPQTGLMLSALVQYLNENDAGPGFFDLARRLGLLRSRTSVGQRLEFWASQVAAVHAHYRRPLRGG